MTVSVETRSVTVDSPSAARTVRWRARTAGLAATRSAAVEARREGSVATPPMPAGALATGAARRAAEARGARTAAGAVDIARVARRALIFERRTATATTERRA